MTPDHQGCIVWNEPDLAVDWPSGLLPLLSLKDSNAPSLPCCELSRAA
jgi:dTDP-4-dehydrorhamnose 3,5-epimerase